MAITYFPGTAPRLTGKNKICGRAPMIMCECPGWILEGLSL